MAEEEVGVTEYSGAVGCVSTCVHAGQRQLMNRASQSEKQVGMGVRLEVWQQPVPAPGADLPGLVACWRGLFPRSLSPGQGEAWAPRPHTLGVFLLVPEVALGERERHLKKKGCPPASRSACLSVCLMSGAN